MITEVNVAFVRLALLTILACLRLQWINSCFLNINKFWNLCNAVQCRECFNT